MGNAITIIIEYANGEKYDTHSPDVVRSLLAALKNNLELEYKDRTAEINNINSAESAVIILLSAIDNFEK